MKIIFYKHYHKKIFYKTYDKHLKTPKLKETNENIEHIKNHGAIKKIEEYFEKFKTANNSLKFTFEIEYSMQEKNQSESHKGNCYLEFNKDNVKMKLIFKKYGLNFEYLFDIKIHEKKCIINSPGLFFSKKQEVFLSQKQIEMILCFHSIDFYKLLDMIMMHNKELNKNSFYNVQENFLSFFIYTESENFNCEFKFNEPNNLQFTLIKYNDNEIMKIICKNIKNH